MSLGEAWAGRPMRVLEVGDSVIQLRFLPDGRRLLAGLATEKGVVSFDLCSLAGGGRTRLKLPQMDLKPWWDPAYGNVASVHPSGEWCYVAWAGGLFSFHTADGSPRRPVQAGVWADQIALSPGGDRLLAAGATLAGPPQQLSAVAVAAAGDAVVWQRVPQPVSPRPLRLAGFLPDGERFVTVDDAVRVRTFATGDEQAAGRHRPAGTEQAQLSPDGRHLGMFGYSSMYLFDMTALGKPRRIAGSSNYGNFVSFAFHPAGRALAVIHGGPTLVKLYDVATLRLVHKYDWKLGPLGCVTFSPDGMLGAAGSQDGRVLVWDVDE
jgi:WD40 repeat protein